MVSSTQGSRLANVAPSSSGPGRRHTTSERPDAATSAVNRSSMSVMLVLHGVPAFTSITSRDFPPRSAREAAFGT